MFAKATMCALLASGLFLPPQSAQAGDGWSATLEPEREKVKVNGGSDFYSDSLALSVAYREGANKYDFKVEADKDHDAAAASGAKIEARYRRYFDQLAGIEPSVRVSVGENFGSGLDFSFYTIQPKLAYEIGSWEPYISIRYRNAFDTSHKYMTFTSYLGAAYDAGNGWEIEPSVFHKNGDDHTNGVKLEITKSFN
jgi:hypothetical protein